MTMLRKFAVLAAVLAAAAACSPSPGGAQAPAGAEGQPVTMTMESTPSPPQTGANTVVITVTQAGAPVTDASVTGEFFMPVMESMGKTTAEFRHDGGGRYTGQGNLSMAGSWQVTVTARRGDRTLAMRTFNLTAKQ